MNNNFSFNIESISDEPECYEYEISFLDENSIRHSGAGTCPSIEMCFDSAMNYYSEVMHGYEDTIDDTEDDFLAILDDEDWD